jgi:hypothetical protein
MVVLSIRLRVSRPTWSTCQQTNLSIHSGGPTTNLCKTGYVSKFNASMIFFHVVSTMTSSLIANSIDFVMCPFIKIISFLRTSKIKVAVLYSWDEIDNYTNNSVCVAKCLPNYLTRVLRIPGIPTKNKRIRLRDKLDLIVPCECEYNITTTTIWILS